MKLNKIAKQSVYIMYFIPYLGIVYPGYYLMILLLFFSKLYNTKYNKYDLIFIILFSFVSFLKIFHTGFTSADAILRFYYGVVLTYLYFVEFNLKIDINKILTVLTIFIIIEIILINTIINPFQYLLNYPRSVFEMDLLGHDVRFMGFYRRPYSIGGNASTSSTIYCAILLLRKYYIKKYNMKNSIKKEIIYGFIVIAFASGVGFIMYIYYLIYSKELLKIKNFIKLFILLFITTMISTYLFDFLPSDNIFRKISAIYIKFLIDFKIGQIQNVIDILYLDENSIYWGQVFESKSQIVILSDFAWKDMVQCLGVLGLLLFVLFLISSISIISLPLVFIFIIGAFHYGGGFTLPGQLVMAQMLYIGLIDKNEMRSKNDNTSFNLRDC